MTTHAYTSKSTKSPFRYQTLVSHNFTSKSSNRRIVSCSYIDSFTQTEKALCPRLLNVSSKRQPCYFRHRVESLRTQYESTQSVQQRAIDERRAKLRKKLEARKRNNKAAGAGGGGEGTPPPYEHV